MKELEKNEMNIEGTLKQNALILKSAGEGIYGLDSEGNITFVNPAATKLLGYSTEEMVGKPQHDLVRHSKEDGIPSPKEDCHIYAAIKDGKVHRENNEVFWKKDGGFFPAEYVSTPILENSKITGAVVTFRDITAKKREESRNTLRYGLTKVLAHEQTIDDGLVQILQILADHPTWDMAFYWKLDPEGNVLNCRLGAYSKRFSKDSYELFSEKTFSIIFEKGMGLPGRILDSTKPAWIKDVSTDRNFPRYSLAEKVGIHSGFGFPIFTEDKFWGVIEVFTIDTSDPDKDLNNLLENMGSQIGLFMQRIENKENLISEKEKKENLFAELKDHVNRLKELDELKNKFLGMAAHDLRNPLVSIRGLSELLLDKNNKFSDEEVKELIETMHDASKHMFDLVNDLLDTSVIESGKLELELETCSLKKLAFKRVHAHELLAENKKMKIHHSLEDIPEFYLDPNRVIQIIDNLLTNAIKFSNPGSNIFVSLKKISAGIKFCVRDEGPGISDSDQEKLFEDFQKLSARPTGGESSTGLGLAIVKKMVEAHSGAMCVESRLGVGSTFSFTLSNRLNNNGK
jgi:PAS domain S-box-containing protein